MTNIQRITSEEYRNIIGHFSSGVTIITTSLDGEKYGVTASSVTSVSLEPPLLLVCVNKNTGTCHAVSQSKVFGVHILNNEQEKLARQFATPNIDKFENVEVDYGHLNVPILKNNLAYLECKVVNEYSEGTHSVFIGEVVNTSANIDEKPLAYYRGKFWNIDFDSDL